MKLTIPQQLEALKTLVGTKLFIFTVDFTNNIVIAVCKAKPALRYTVNIDGTDILETDLKCGIEILDMTTTVQDNKEFLQAVDATKQLKPTKSEINEFRAKLRKANKR